MQSFFNNTNKDKEYINKEAALGTIKKHANIALSNWLKSQTSERVILLQNSLDNFLNVDSDSFKLLPASLKKIILNPHEVFPSLITTLTSDEIKQALCDSIKFILEHNSDNCEVAVSNSTSNSNSQSNNDCILNLNLSSSDLLKSFINLPNDEFERLCKAVDNAKQIRQNELSLSKRIIK
jgi:hypothetical protein